MSRLSFIYCCRQWITAACCSLHRAYQLRNLLNSHNMLIHMLWLLHILNPSKVFLMFMKFWLSGLSAMPTTTKDDPITVCQITSRYIHLWMQPFITFSFVTTNSAGERIANTLCLCYSRCISYSLFSTRSFEFVAQESFVTILKLGCRFKKIERFVGQVRWWENHNEGQYYHLKYFTWKTFY